MSSAKVSEECRMCPLSKKAVVLIAMTAGPNRAERVRRGAWSQPSGIFRFVPIRGDSKNP